MALTIIVQRASSDPLTTFLFFGGSLGLIFALLAALLWARVYSIPKILRKLNKMIKAISKGKVPDAPEVGARNELVRDMINEGLEEIRLSKPLDEIPLESIDLHVPEVEDLLIELAEITGLNEEDITVFRSDLARMKPSERPGFIQEVIVQEKARRAEDIAKKKKKKKARKKATKGELEEVRIKLKKLGIDGDELELIMENAKDLTKAEIDALLEDMNHLQE
jgi:hypothetical protein